MTPNAELKPRKPISQITLLELLVLVTIIAALLGFLVPAYREAKDAASASQCKSNLRQLALAMLNYRDTWKIFPPANTPGLDGTPWHSWRILIVPFVESSALYDQYHFDEPWNGPRNRKLCPTAWSVFRCPADDGPATDTSYLAVTGPGTMWPDDGSTELADILDFTSNTIMIVEVTNSGVHWMEPRDLRIDAMDFQINGKIGKSISSRHVRGAAVVFADGHVEMLGPETTEARLKEWLTMEGDE